jgi:hypothetical protein
MPEHVCDVRERLDRLIATRDITMKSRRIYVRFFTGLRCRDPARDFGMRSCPRRSLEKRKSFYPSVKFSRLRLKYMQQKELESKVWPTEMLKKKLVSGHRCHAKSLRQNSALHKPTESISKDEGSGMLLSWLGFVSSPKGFSIKPAGSTV